MTGEEIVGQFKKPWLKWSEAEKMTVLAGFTRTAWEEKFRDLVKSTGECRARRYSRDSLAEVLGLVPVAAE